MANLASLFVRSRCAAGKLNLKKAASSLKLNSTRMLLSAAPLAFVAMSYNKDNRMKSTSDQEVFQERNEEITSEIRQSVGIYPAVIESFTVVLGFAARVGKRIIAYAENEVKSDD